MELIKLRNEIISLLYRYVKRPVIMMKQPFNRPVREDGETDYPFIACSMISFVPDKGMGTYEQREVISENPNFKTDIIETLTLQMRLSMSFTAYAKEKAQAFELASKAAEYFRHAGYFEFSKRDIVIVKTGGIKSRDIFETDDYERREGFDVDIRHAVKSEKRFETMEKHKIGKRII